MRKYTKRHNITSIITPLVCRECCLFPVESIEFPNNRKSSILYCYSCLYFPEKTKATHSLLLSTSEIINLHLRAQVECAQSCTPSILYKEPEDEVTLFLDLCRKGSEVVKACEEKITLENIRLLKNVPVSNSWLQRKFKLSFSEASLVMQEIGAR